MMINIQDLVVDYTCVVCGGTGVLEFEYMDKYSEEYSDCPFCLFGSIENGPVARRFGR